jgi:hypothetical protein
VKCSASAIPRDIPMSANASATKLGQGGRTLILREARARRRSDSVVSLIVSTWRPSALTVDDLWPGLVYHQAMKRGTSYVTAGLPDSNRNNVRCEDADTGAPPKLLCEESCVVLSAKYTADKSGV